MTKGSILYDGSTTAANNWGARQATVFYDEWINHNNVMGYTLFGDIESGFGGWLESGNSLNHAVYQGFMSTISLKSWAGVYSSIGEWSNIMGESYDVTPATIEWAANYPTGTCTYCPTSFNPESFGGMGPTIWQYQGNPPCPADLDCATTLHF